MQQRASTGRHAAAKKGAPPPDAAAAPAPQRRRRRPPARQQADPHGRPDLPSVDALTSRTHVIDRLPLERVDRTRAARVTPSVSSGAGSGAPLSRKRLVMG